MYKAAFNLAERAVLIGMLDSIMNCPITTSAGRLFDAVAALAGLRQIAGFEGQAAMELEHAADESVTEPYPFPVGGRPLRLDWGPMVEAILWDVQRGATVSRVGSKLLCWKSRLAECFAITSRCFGSTMIIWL